MAQIPSLRVSNTGRHPRELRDQKHPSRCWGQHEHEGDGGEEDDDGGDGGVGGRDDYEDLRGCRRHAYPAAPSLPHTTLRNPST